MGLDCLGGPKDEQKATARKTSRELDRRLADWSKPFQKAMKILLLGILIFIIDHLTFFRLNIKYLFNFLLFYGLLKFRHFFKEWRVSA